VGARTGQAARDRLLRTAQPVRTRDVPAGATLALLDTPSAGARAYLAIAGGIDVPEYLGSRSTFILGKFGGHAGRTRLDARGFVGLFGSPVLALRAQASHAGATLPPAEQALLGGGPSVRGYRAGNRAGDSLAAVSAELRVPLTSPLNFGRFGVKAFVDAGTVWNANQRLADQPWDRGIGGGV